ncbi:hypothetical protein [Achromobacter marplatensis]|uniref:hypothetical protein n=1 Tax=Achromobacter marplatensis TaxID=470868 RepID=UPI0028E78CD1|nr:hypothetical protein [Achromobacter marplatensis]
MNTEWKPIDSAPQTGRTLLLGYWNSCGKWRTVRGQWMSLEYIAEHWEDPDDAEAGWFETAVEADDVPNCWPVSPSHWQPMPTPPCPTCNDQGAVGNILTAEPCPDCSPPAPTSHPIPTGATGDRDWELACDECNGSGHVFVKHQVAERKTDVQEFKEECEACEGRGFNIAFEDIPGIADYVKSCGSDAGVTGEDEQSAFERWLERTCPSGDVESVQRQWEASSDYADFHAPAAGDALPTIKGAAITGGYVVVTTRGWDADRAVKLRDAILRLFPVDPTYTPKPDAAQQGKGEAL